MQSSKTMTCHSNFCSVIL